LGREGWKRQHPLPSSKLPPQRGRGVAFGFLGKGEDSFPFTPVLPSPAQI